MIRTAIKFGIFVGVCLFLTIYLAFMIGNIQLSDPLGRDYYDLSATFDDVTGLLPNDNVKVAGVVVGKVTSISVEAGRAEVDFQVSKDYRFASDSRFEMRWRNLIGQRYLYVIPGQSSTTLEEGDALTKACESEEDTACTESVVDLGALFDRLGPVIGSLDPADVNVFLESVGGALDGNVDQLSKAIDDLAILTRSLGERDAAIGRLIQNIDTVVSTLADRDQQIEVILDNLVTLATVFSANTDVLDEALTQFGPFATDLNALLSGNSAELDRIIDNVHTLAVETVRPNLGRLDATLAGLYESSYAVFSAGRLGEWLNQSILCFSVEPVGEPGSCLIPPLGIPGDAQLSGPLAAATAPAGGAGHAGVTAPSHRGGVDALVGLVLGGVR